MMMDKVEKAVLELGGNPTFAPGYDGAVIRVVLVFRDGRYSWAAEDSAAVQLSSEYEVICTYPEFMEARKRLENKPEDWPEGINWKIQDDSGVWFCSAAHPERSRFGGYEWDEGPVFMCGKGQLFGESEDTLEPRPQPDNKEGEGVEWEPGIDLPPVGVECEFIDSLGDWHEVVITAHAMFGICFVCKDQNGENYTAKDARKFRGLKSHRDKCIESAYKAFPETPTHTKKVLGMAYDAGFLRLPNDKEGCDGSEECKDKYRGRLIAALSKAVNEAADWDMDSGELKPDQGAWVYEAEALLDEVTGGER